MSIFGQKKDRKTFINGLEYNISGEIQKVLSDENELLLSQNDICCNGCLRELRGRYYSVLGYKNVFLCVGCFKLIQTLWRLENLELLELTNLELKEIK